MAKIILAGGTGHLGTLIIPILMGRGDDLIVLSRSKRTSEHTQLKYVYWDGKTIAAWKSEMEGADVLLNLSGLNIKRRFTTENKRLLTESRVDPTLALGHALSDLSDPVKLWVNFSGVSLYDGAGSLQDEGGTDFGDTFMAELVKKWESAFHSFRLSGTRQVVFRVSPVLSKEFGMFRELYPIVRMGLGGTVGTGKQIIPWIHESDLVGMLLWIMNIENPASVYHACSPNPVNNKDFMRIFREVCAVKIGLPLPALLAKIGAYVKGVDPNLLLESVPVTTKLSINDGYAFNFPYLQPALNQLVQSSI